MKRVLLHDRSKKFGNINCFEKIKLQFIEFKLLNGYLVCQTYLF